MSGLVDLRGWRSRFPPQVQGQGPISKKRPARVEKNCRSPENGCTDDYRYDVLCNVPRRLLKRTAMKTNDRLVGIRWLSACYVIGRLLFDNSSVQVSSSQHCMATPAKGLAIPGRFNTPVLRQCLMRNSSSPLNCGAKIFRTGNYFAANWTALGDL